MNAAMTTRRDFRALRAISLYTKGLRSSERFTFRNLIATVAKVRIPPRQEGERRQEYERRVQAEYEEVEAIIRIALEMIRDELVAGNPVILWQIGTLKPTVMRARYFYRPTGEVKEHDAPHVRFTTARKLKADMQCLGQ